MKKRDERQERREIVKREYQTAIVALRMLDHQLRLNPSMLGRHDLRPDDFRNLDRHLEATYSVRLFAEFETGLREVWKHTVRDTNPKTFELIDALGVRRNVETSVVRDVHAARAYRNSLVHEESDEAVTVPFMEAARSYRRFFARMPSDW